MYSKKKDDLDQKLNRIDAELYNIILNMLAEKADLMADSEEYVKLVEKVYAGKTDPYSAASKLVRGLVK